MILVIGGVYQGKTEYVAEEYNVLRSEMYDCETSVTHDFSRYKCAYNYQCEVGRNIENKIDPVKAAEKLIRENPDIIIIMNEVGSGIVPLKKSERLWREQVGKVGCYLAEKAKKVVRVVCGCTVRIK